jgi:hypothetical protein
MTITLIESNFDDVELIAESVNGKKFHYIHGIFAQADVVNGNKRVYPEKILDESMNGYIDKFVKTNRAVGELIHPACYAKGATVITHNRGVIPIENVVVGDSVYGVDSNGDTCITSVTGVINEHYDGVMLDISNRSIRAVVTPNHRFYLQTRHNGLVAKTAQELHDSINGSNKLSHDYIPQTMVGYESESPEFITFPAIKNNKRKKYQEDLTVPFSWFVKLAGIYFSEGNVKYKKTSTGEIIPHAVSIHQNTNTNFDLILDMISEQRSLTTNITIKGTGAATINISDMRIANYFSKYGKECYTKTIPREITNSSKEDVSEFLEWFVLGDGALTKANHTTKSGALKSYTYKNLFTTSRQMAYDLEECMIKVGYSVHERIQISNSDYEFAGHTIKIESKSPLYRINFGKRKGAYIDARMMTSKEVQYSDTVHCLQTETNNFFVIYDGYAHLTGNSLEIGMDRISHLVTEMKKDGKNYVGKARVLNTPTGKIVQALLEGGVRLGVSTRAGGKVITNSRGLNEVAPGLDMKAIDIVYNPSAPNALVDSIMESVDGVIDALSDDMQLVESIKADILKASSRELQSAKLKAFKQIMESLRA